MIGGETWTRKFHILQNLALHLYDCHLQLILFQLKVSGRDLAVVSMSDSKLLYLTSGSPFFFSRKCCGMF